MLTCIERNYESRDARGKSKNKFGEASVNMIRDEYNWIFRNALIIQGWRCFFVSGYGEVFELPGSRNIYSNVEHPGGKKPYGISRRYDTTRFIVETLTYVSVVSRRGSGL
jgi:hypothetical protein